MKISFTPTSSTDSTNSTNLINYNSGLIHCGDCKHFGEFTKECCSIYPERLTDKNPEDGYCDKAILRSDLDNQEYKKHLRETSDYIKITRCKDCEFFGPETPDGLHWCQEAVECPVSENTYCWLSLPLNLVDKIEAKARSNSVETHTDEELTKFIRKVYGL